MTTQYRPTTSADGTVLNGSLIEDPEDYRDMRFNKLILGVILYVYPSDRPETRSSQQTSDRHGHTHECTVQVVNDGSSAYMVLENVIITPDAPSGLDDYVEKLPRGSKAHMGGSLVDSSLREIDPYDLDGDWCIVGFLGGRIEAPFIVRWWPHARNTFDTATSGLGNDETALVQDRRYFRRTNGVETVVTGKGNIVVSTTLANTTISPGGKPKLGRFARTESPEEGGSIRINIKPTQYFELTWNPQEDGIGTVDDTDPELPQTNPPDSDPMANGNRPESYVYADRDQVDFYIPATFTVVTGDSATIKAENLIELESKQIKLGAGAGDDPVVLGEKLRDFLKSVEVLSPFGPLKINPTQLTPESIYDNILSTKSVVE